jgi:RNA recognition motif-containing protein
MEKKTKAEKKLDATETEPADEEINFDQNPFELEGNPEALIIGDKTESEAALEESKKSNNATLQNGGPSVAAPLPDEDRDSRSVFVKNVHYAAEKSEIEEHFRDSGEINMITICSNKISH